MVPAEDLTVVTPADWVPGPTQGLWTYNDYATLPEDGQRYEIVNGKTMQPSYVIPNLPVQVEQFFI